jgi:putative FmdB family regulatory protein
MPIYECHCLGCDLTFEVLAPLSQAGRRHPCPRCNRPAPRIASAFAIASGGGSRESQAETATAKKPGAPEQPPLCLRYPHVPLLCHMDQKAAKRWLAHYDGRGAEYDDRQAAREDLRKKRGLPPEPPPAPPTHSHEHGRNFRRHQAQGTTEHGNGDRHEHSGHHEHHETGHPHSGGAEAHPHEHAPKSHAHQHTASPRGHAHAHRGDAHSH